MRPAPRIGIRLDCGPAVGLGHVHRCLPVARVLASRGAAVRFVVAGGEPGPERLRRAGFPVDALPRPGAAAFRDWLVETGEGMDAWLLDLRDDLSAEDVRALRPAVTAVLDDPTDKRLAADFAFYPPVPQVGELDWTGYGGRLLTGFAYVPLDERLFEPPSGAPAPEGAPPALPVPEDGPTALLVTMGGTDPHGLTLLALRAVAAMSANVAATVVVPAACPVRRDCLGLARELGGWVLVVDGPTELLPRMRRADLALAAFGTTAYELAALGRPAVLVGLSPDHARAADCLAGPGAAENAGYFADLAPSALAARLDGLARSPARRAALSRNALALGLGPGAAVIADILLDAIAQAAPATREPTPMTAKAADSGHHGPTLAEAKGYTLIDCRVCGFAHVLPLPDPEAMARAYREAYYGQEKPEYLVHQTEDRAWLDLVHGERAALLAEHLGGARGERDLGCGGGFFLDACRQAGFAVHGVEPARQAAAHARDVLGLAVTEGFLDDAVAAALPRFDAVHAAEVLEHLPDPAGMLRRIHGLLAPGGLLLVSLPNDGNPLQAAAERALALPPWWLAPPHHLNYFTPASIAALLARVGFQVLQAQASFPMELFLLMGDNYVVDPALGRACQAKRKAFELAMAAAGLSGLKTRLYEALAGLGIGRTVVTLARRAASSERPAVVGEAKEK